VRVAAIAIAVCAVAVVALAIIGWPASAYRDSDWMQYYAGSNAIVAGASPWDADWWRAFHERAGSAVIAHPPHTGDPATDWTTPYPLWTFVLLLPFAFLPLAIAAPAFAVAQVAAVLAAAWVLARMLVPPRAVLVAVALVASSQPLWSLIAGGNVTGYAAAAFGFALVAALRGRPMLAGVLLAGCLLKPSVFAVAALALVLGVLPDERRPLLTGAAAATLAIVLPTFALRVDWVPQWLAAVGHLQATSMSNATGWTIARPFGSDVPVWSAAVVTLAVVTFVVWWRRDRPDLVTLIAAALPASVLASPHGWSYDYVALVPTAVAGLGSAYAARSRSIALIAVVLVAVVTPWALNVVAFARNGEDLSAFVLVAAEALVLAGAVRARASPIR
jgi:hypothetical protein